MELLIINYLKEQIYVHNIM